MMRKQKATNWAAKQEQHKDTDKTQYIKVLYTNKERGLL